MPRNYEISKLTPEERLDRKRELARERGRRYRERNPDRVRELSLARRKKWVEENPVGWRSAQYKYNYGINADDYAVLLLRQNGVCAICGCAPVAGKLLHVDHDHATGNVRGLLCRSCNLAIGYFKDCEERMKKAIAYIKRHSTITHA